MEKYIIAVDMDGTLLNSENKISGRNRNVLQRLIDEGHYVVPATGRTKGADTAGVFRAPWSEMGNRGKWLCCLGLR